MATFSKFLPAAGAVILAGLASQAQAACSGPPITIPGYTTEVEGPISVKTGTACVFGVMGIEGAISEVKITQMPKVGKAGVENLRAYYIAKPGYQGPDEFAYAFIGKDQYGGPMRIVMKRKVTVVPNL